MAEFSFEERPNSNRYGNGRPGPRRRGYRGGPHQMQNGSRGGNHPQNFNVPDVNGDGPPYTVFVGNLPKYAIECDIEMIFDGIEIDRIRLIKDKETDEFKGFAYVDVLSKESLDKALELDEALLDKNKIRIDLADHGGGRGGNSRGGWNHQAQRGRGQRSNGFVPRGRGFNHWGGHPGEFPPRGPHQDVGYGGRGGYGNGANFQAGPMGFQNFHPMNGGRGAFMNQPPGPNRGRGGRGFSRGRSQMGSSNSLPRSRVTSTGSQGKGDQPAPLTEEERAARPKLNLLPRSVDSSNVNTFVNTERNVAIFGKSVAKDPPSGSSSTPTSGESPGSGDASDSAVLQQKSEEISKTEEISETEVPESSAAKQPTCLETETTLETKLDDALSLNT